MGDASIPPLAGRRNPLNFPAAQHETVTLSKKSTRPPILVRASKTDQAGQGAVLALEPRVVEALRTWLDTAGISDGWVFRRLERDGRAGRSPVGSREVAEAFRRIARELGIAGNIGGHSARIGGAHDLVADGESLVGVMQVGCWRWPAMPALYTRKLSALATAKARKARRDRVSSASLQKVRRPTHRRAATHQRNRYSDNRPWTTVHHDHAVHAMLSATR